MLQIQMSRGWLPFGEVRLGLRGTPASSSWHSPRRRWSAASILTSLTVGADVPVVDAAVADADADSSDASAVSAAPVDFAGTCPAGVACQKASDPCHTDAVCDENGVCGALGERPDGYGYDPANPLNRCCGGKAVPVNTVQNCGACGISCGAQACVYTHGPHYFCACSGDNHECWSQCCSTSYGLPNVCAAGNCATSQPITCPGNAILGNDAQGPYYCHY